METFEEMYARHDRDMKELMEKQQTSWEVLREQYGEGDFPADVYKQWDEQYGNIQLHGLRAQQYAEAEAYPLNPLEYRYQQEAETQKQQAPVPDIFEQLKQKQQRIQDITSKQLHDPKGSEPDDVFAALRRKQQELDRKGPGDDDR